ncbi:DNA (cytosine-5-)-methyltransferase [Clostridium cochlearium]|uniref:DNA (cytosine-5-)-methyltransferase n=1 Tax=Clostridium cochlearium TaxID=1494 RepID=UPI000B94765A|nr:DNA (cytosine-5-)-methyltransferase [Clostridium cochlearium]MBU5270130.1 DNA (cytosine-5-)-methyltransferase [Clostridium cochlearium]MBU5270147.1 DNA (cytosine-5-)-methyltransferase [Clostridium cochlearium]SNV83786.1 DNA-methyltransferase [Clostridium cochlearium]STA93133.1 DNA-methyltransferase [Clostridium cochlearium]
MPFRVGSLFAGVGGICLGFKNAVDENGDNGYELVWANEIDEYAAVTYRTNFNHNLIVGDIEKIVNLDRCIDELERELYETKRWQILDHQIDILTGGFPCQAFSIAGKRKGFDDHRGNLFWSIIDLVNLINNTHGEKPRVLFLENVKNLQSHDGGKTYEVIKRELIRIGYTVKEAVLNTMDFTNIPQNRERIFIVCFLNEEDADRFTIFDKDENGRYIHLNEYKNNFTADDRRNQINAIIDYNLNFNDLEKYYYKREKYPHYFLTEEEYLQIPVEERKEIRINLDEQITYMYQFYQIRRGMYVRRNMNGVCPTLTANMGTGGHNVPLIRVNDGIRKITPAEAFKLQGFPVGYEDIPLIEGGTNYILPANLSDGRLYKQAGNAVTVPLITFIAEKILEVLI